MSISTKLSHVKYKRSNTQVNNCPLCSDKKNLNSRWHIKNAGADSYNLLLTVNKNDVYDYVDILRQILETRDFCQNNATLFNSLTCREREILKYIINGFKNSDIANYFFLSVETVKTHRKNILSKLQRPNMLTLSQYIMFFKN